MLSSPYPSVKSVNMDIFLINITMWSLYFPKVGEWITRRGAVGAKKTGLKLRDFWIHHGPSGVLIV